MKRQTVQATISAAKEERPVAELVQLANRFKSSIYFEASNKVINAKSIMGMMTLNLISGLDVTITADGEDEEVAVEQLAAYITGK